jgi:ribose/xylose/arabinose/galactoside ABC-type transport system permease subunit
VVTVWFSLRAPGFLSVENVRLLAKQSAQLAVVSAGMTLVIASGGIDISVGSLVGLCSMLLGWLAASRGWGIWQAAAGAIVAGALCGLGNGLLIARARLAPIIVTLATFAAARAGGSLIGGGGSISDLSPALNHALFLSGIAGIPVTLWISAAALTASAVLLRYTAYGRTLLALGESRMAASLSGLKVARVEALAYTISGAMAGIAAVLTTAYKATATPDSGQYLELSAITAVVLGGTRITGGKASVLGTALGVATITVLVSGARLMGQEDRVAWFLVGAALLLAVEIQNRRSQN